jgi:hypothetical protein
MQQQALSVQCRGGMKGCSSWGRQGMVWGFQDSMGLQSRLDGCSCSCVQMGIGWFQHNQGASLVAFPQGLLAKVRP